MVLSEKILYLARLRGLTLKQVAEASGVPYNTLRAYTKPGSRTVPTAPNGIAIAKALSVPTDWLFDEDADPPAPPRMEMPPFEIVPWPPNMITWERMRQVLGMWFDTMLVSQLSKFAEKQRQDPSHIQKLAPSDRDALLTGLRYYLEHGQREISKTSDRSWKEIVGELEEGIGPLLGELLKHEPAKPSSRTNKAR